MSISQLLLGIFETSASNFGYGFFKSGDVRFSPKHPEDAASYLHVIHGNRRYRVTMPTVPLYSFMRKSEAEKIAHKAYIGHREGKVYVPGHDTSFVRLWSPIIYGLLWSGEDSIELRHNLPDDLIETIKIEYFEGKLRA